VIILCEDDADQRTALRLALEQAKYSVRGACDGDEALALQRQRASPVLITDIFMPETDGFELIEAIKKEFPSTKVVAISGGKKRLVDYLESARLMGVDATFEKPFKVESLLAALKRLAH
jgi:CheY-like chemotaxis protein